MKRLAIAVGALVALAVAGYVFYLIFSGPRMRTQAHVSAFEAALPRPPAGAVPVKTSLPSVPSREVSRSMQNPLSASKKNIQKGRTYYVYYCVACHGEGGKAPGPVGESYVPTPPDLREADLSRYSDGELLRAMLVGTGHEPVLGRVVPPEHRWPLVLYLRELNSDKGEPQEAQ